MSVYGQIKKKFDMPNAYQDWSRYREQVTKLILRDVGQTIVGYTQVKDGAVKKRMKPIYKNDGLSIAILGAGSCSDIDIVELSEHFDKIVLIDVDRASMMKAVAWMPEILKERITLKTGSITGITDEDQRNFCDRILSKVSCYGTAMSLDDYTNYLLDELIVISNKMYKDDVGLSQADILPVAGYDVVVCLGVHSQLMSLLSYTINVLLHNISEQLFMGKEPDEEKITAYLKDMNSRIIPIINSAILKCSREKAVFGNEHDGARPVEGAYQCIMDLRRRGLPITEEHLTWNFNPEQNVTYDMLIQMI